MESNELQFHVGCLGFRGPKARYFKRLNVWELAQSELKARPATLRKWRAEAPAGVQFVAPVDPGVAAANFVGPEAEAAWARTVAVAEALGAAVVLLRTPSAFRPSAGNRAAFEAFFKDRAGPRVAWWAEGLWEGQPEVRDALCAATGLIPVADPLADDEDEPLPTVGDQFFWRVRGRMGLSGRLSDYDLDVLLDRAEQQGRSGYVLFTQPDMLRDAQRLAEMLGVDPNEAPGADEPTAGDDQDA